MQQGNAAICAQWIRSARRVGVFSGAGLSTNAGIPDFRGPQGLYRTLKIADPEAIFDIQVFRRDPTLFYRFHRGFLDLLDTVEPTETHRFFARLEREGVLSGIVTQNIDGLHQRAGSRRVLEIHGGVGSNTCTRCGTPYDLQTLKELLRASEVPRCPRCDGTVKPDVVFFGEGVQALEACRSLMEETDLLFVVGSSLVVTPAALLPALCPGTLVVVNQGEVSSAYLPPRRVALRVEEDLDDFFRSVERAYDEGA